MSPPRPYDALAPGDELGAYRVVRRLGAGGMGVVYEAFDVVLERTVALKLIAPAKAADPDFRRRFVREARAQAALDSPHVVQVFAHGEVAGRLYIATQLVPDGDLAALLREGPVPPDVAVEVAAQVADGLAEAHRAGLVHRDVKPGNVLLRRRGTHLAAYLSDFGIASPTASSRGPRLGVPAGTPGYLAPEVLAGASGSPAADVYALGRLLVAALGGDPTRPAPDLTAGLPGGRCLRRLLRRVLAADPVERPSAADLASALRALSGTTPATRVRGRGRVRRPLRPGRVAGTVARLPRGRLARVVVLAGVGVALTSTALALQSVGPTDSGATRAQVTATPTAPTATPGPGSADDRTAQVTAALARAGLSETEADCAAAALLRRTDRGSAPSLDPASVSAALAATAGCLWPHAAP